VQKEVQFDVFVQDFSPETLQKVKEAKEFFGSFNTTSGVTLISELINEHKITI
jgi:hypothetical protein